METWTAADWIALLGALGILVAGIGKVVLDTYRGIADIKQGIAKQTEASTVHAETTQKAVAENTQLTRAVAVASLVPESVINAVSPPIVKLEPVASSASLTKQQVPSGFEPIIVEKDI